VSLNEGVMVGVVVGQWEVCRMRVDDYDCAKKSIYLVFLRVNYNDKFVIFLKHMEG